MKRARRVASEAEVPLRTRQDGPRISDLERCLGDFLLEEEIARTPRAAIYRIRAGDRIAEPLALKVALRPFDAEGLVRFQHEVRLLSEVRHPNVVEVYDFGVLPGGFPFLTMELLPGLDLGARGAGGDWEGFATLALQAAAGLAHIHRHGIVHLDIKPGNLGSATDEEGKPRLKILDFGLAQDIHSPLDRRIRGTLAYAAPEILLQDRYDHRADLYSLGVTLFQLATGVLPSAGSDEDAIRFHLQAEPPDPLAYRPDMPAALGAILRRLLARDPQHRFPSAGKLLLELADVSGAAVDPASMALGEGRVLASRMVGREELMERLRARLGEAGRGALRVIVVEGEEGVGKSRLLREFRLLAAMQGARVGVGRSVAGRPEPLGALRAALRHLGLVLPPLGRPGARDVGERFELYRRAFEELRHAGAEGGPVVLLLEDLQAAGEETREWIAHLARGTGEARVLVVGARRRGGAAADEGDWVEEAGIEHLRVEPLEAAGVHELVDASLGTGLLPQALYDWLAEHSGGNPGALQSLLHHLIEQRVLRYRQGEWKPSLPSLARLAAHREDLGRLDRERLASLSPAAVAVLEAASVVGEPFHWRHLAELMDEPAEEVYGVAAALFEEGLLERPSEGESGQSVLGPGLARTLYEGLATERRRELHRRWAELLEASLGERPERAAAVAEHYWQAGERARSLPHLLAAGEAALGVYGHREAIDLFSRAAEVAAEQGDATAAFAAQVRQAEALAASGSTVRALGLYRKLLARRPEPARRLDDRRRDAALWLAVARLHGRLAEGDEELAAADRGLELLEAGREPRTEVELMATRAEALARLGRRGEAFVAARQALRQATRRHLTQARAELLDLVGQLLTERGEVRKASFLLHRALGAAREVEDAALAARVRDHLGEVDQRQGHLDDAAARYRRNLDEAQRVRDPWLELTALDHLAALELARSAWREARDPVRRALDLRRRLGAREGEETNLLRLGEVEEQLGDWSRADRHYRRVLRLLGDELERAEGVAATAGLASLARKRGDWAEAEQLAGRALTEAERRGNRRLLGECHLELGLVERDREHWAPASAHLQRSRELLEETAGTAATARPLNALAELCLRRGEAAEAEDYAARARSAGEVRGDRFELAKTMLVEARLALLRQETERGDELFAEAVERLEAAATPFEHARALAEWGVRSQSPDQAIERLDRALAAFERLGAATEFERTRGVIEGIRERHQLGTGSRPAPGLWEVAKVVNSTLDLQEVLDRTMDLVLERLGAERGMVVLSQPLTGELEVAVARNLGEGEGGAAAHLSETVVRQVIQQREPVLSVDALRDPRFVGAESIVASHIVSILCVPLVIRERLAGAIYVDHSRSQHLFGERDLEFLVAFADQAALAIDNARLYGELESHRQRLKAENESLRQEILSNRHLGSLIGKSRAIAHLKDTLERVAPSSSTVLVRGESGTGKGLVARILHSLSPRREGPFVAFNCAALPETLVESELFGHEKGSFTGAVGQKPGRFELAHKGTIFLDEIGKVSRSVQAKLLRVVEDREFERVGGTRTIKSDVRVVAATNLNLEEAIQKGEFREDLYYRLNIIPIVLPPLRERREDIPYLVDHFLTKISRDLGHERKAVDPGVMELFLAYRWPGNVREIEAAVHRALVLGRGDTLMVEDFAWIGAGERAAGQNGAMAAAAVHQLEEGNYAALIDRLDRELIAAALERSGGRIREAARYLGIARNTLKAKMKRLEMPGS